MQFEEFDNKAKEAADHHHPAYDEQAWAKMQKLLDRHLPQKEDKRKRFIFFLLFFLGIGAAGILIAKKWKGSGSAPVAGQIASKQQSPGTPATEAGSKEPVQLNNEINLKSDDASNTDKTGIANSVIPGNSNINKTVTGSAEGTPQVSHTSPGNMNSTDPGKTTSIHSEGTSINIPGKGDNEINNKLPETKTAVSVNNKKTDPVSDSKRKDQQETVKTNQPLNTTTDPALMTEPGKNTDVKTEEQVLVQQKENRKKARKKNNSFFFTFSTGPDVSFADKEKLGTMKLQAGAGLSYTFNNRFTIRAGFYSGRKVYTAFPDTYHPPAPFYTYYPYLEKVDADCKVYEIPLAFSYNFGGNSKQNWFASGAVSSYIMKRETYDYFFKTTPAGPTINRKRSIYNVNKHYFSALTFSGGYQRNISRNISFMVEPYLKIPLSGVGYGKVKLHSAGVLFSVGIKPFAAKKGKPAFRR